MIFLLVFSLRCHANVNQESCKNLHGWYHLVNQCHYPITDSKKSLFSARRSWLMLIMQHTVSPYGLCSIKVFLMINLSGSMSCQTLLVFMTHLIYCLISLVWDFSPSLLELPQNSQICFKIDTNGSESSQANLFILWCELSDPAECLTSITAL